MLISHARNRSGFQKSTAVPMTERLEQQRQRNLSEGINRNKIKLTEMKYLFSQNDSINNLILIPSLSDGRLHGPHLQGEPELQRRREQEAQLQEHLRADKVPQSDQHSDREDGQRSRRLLPREGTQCRQSMLVPHHTINVVLLPYCYVI